MKELIRTRQRPVLYGANETNKPRKFLAKTYDVEVDPGIANYTECVEALEAYKSVLKTESLPIVITAKPGQAVSFNQQQLLHGRGPIMNERYREMVRSYGRFSLHAMLKVSQPQNRVFDALRYVDV